MGSLAYATQNYHSEYHDNVLVRTPMKQWIVRGGSSTGQTFRSERKADEYATWLNTTVDPSLRAAGILTPLT